VLAAVLIKIVPIIVLPLWSYYFFADKLSPYLGRLRPKLKKICCWMQEKINYYFFDLLSLLLFLPLFTERSTQFHPWYLSWSFLWLPWLKLKWWRGALVIFSLSGFWHYLPYFLSQQYDEPTFLWQKILLWTPAIIYVTLRAGFYVLAKTKRH
jgi:hypothetical protein